MTNDPIVEQLHKVREESMRKHHGDLKEYCEYLSKHQRRHKGRLTHGMPKLIVKKIKTAS